MDNVAAPVTGTYLVLVASFDSGFDGSGTYRLTLRQDTRSGHRVRRRSRRTAHQRCHTPGEILRGDLDAWTFTANAGDRIAVNTGDIVDTDDFRPWLRL